MTSFHFCKKCTRNCLCTYSTAILVTQSLYHYAMLTWIGLFNTAVVKGTTMTDTVVEYLVATYGVNSVYDGWRQANNLI